MRWWFALLCGSLAFGQRAQEDAQEIIRRSVQRDYVNFERLKDYTYTQRNEERTYDKQGHLQKTEIEAYEVLILGGQDYEKLIARGDKPLPEKEAAKNSRRWIRKSRAASANPQVKKPNSKKERRERRKFLNEVPMRLTSRSSARSR